MTEMQRLLDRIRRTHDCSVAVPRGQPVLRDGDRLSDDLAEFYGLVGGVSLFEHGTYPIRVVGPEDLVRANPEIVGTDCPDDISDSWYIVARGGRRRRLPSTAALSGLVGATTASGTCHGLAGDCRVVALSFTELLRRLFDNGGGYWYWLAGDAPTYGDAYGG